MKIKDNDLLPLLLEEFPCLHVSPHALNKMWKQQFRQMEQLTGSLSEQEQEQERSRAKLNTEVEEAQRRYELLVEIIRKEQEHNQRLNLFEEGLAIQKKRVRELRSYARDQREEHKKKHQEELESMENYNKDQFSMLAETLTQEQQEIQVRKKAQEKVSELSEKIASTAVQVPQTRSCASTAVQVPDSQLCFHCCAGSTHSQLQRFLHSRSFQ